MIKYVIEASSTFQRSSIRSCTYKCLGYFTSCLVRWEGDGQYYYARILSAHPQGATVMWIDRDPSHRLVSWEHLVTSSGSCKEPQEHEAWQDLARRSKAPRMSWKMHIGILYACYIYIYYMIYSKHVDRLCVYRWY